MISHGCGYCRGVGYDPLFRPDSLHHVSPPLTCDEGYFPEDLRRIMPVVRFVDLAHLLPEAVGVVLASRGPAGFGGQPVGFSGLRYQAIRGRAWVPLSLGQGQGQILVAQAAHCRQLDGVGSDVGAVGGVGLGVRAGGTRALRACTLIPRLTPRLLQRG